MRSTIAVLAVLFLSTALCPAAVLEFQSPLGPESPGATGSGSVLVTIDTVAHTLAIDADWSGLSGTTTVAHIHCCVAMAGQGAVGVAVTPGTLPGFPVGVSSGTYNLADLDLTDTANYTAGFLNGSGGGTAAGAEAALLAGLMNGTAYFNVHTSAFPGGEIRGFLAPVPEPGTFALAGLALGALALLRRRMAKR